jgi:putative FmdB family regulatory protein
MPIYEYEHKAAPPESCETRFEVLQKASDDALSICPNCGAEVKRVVSHAQFRTKTDHSPDRAAAKGFTTYKKSGEGVWEKTGGEGVDAIVGSEEEIQSVKEESKPVKTFDLDN